MDSDETRQVINLRHKETVMSPILNETRNWTGDVGEIETEAAVVDPATGQEIKPCTSCLLYTSDAADE